MADFNRKRDVYSAVQLTSEMFTEPGDPAPDGVVVDKDSGVARLTRNDDTGQEGDWIVTCPDGSKLIYNDDDFTALFEAVP